MYWVLFDVAVAVLTLAVVGLTGFALYKHVRTLMRAVSASSSTLGDASAGLNDAQATGIKGP
jgi:hypothetical protein